MATSSQLPAQVHAAWRAHGKNFANKNSADMESKRDERRNNGVKPNAGDAPEYPTALRPESSGVRYRPDGQIVPADSTSLDPRPGLGSGHRPDRRGGLPGRQGAQR